MESDISQRILKIIENEGMSTRGFEKKIGTSNGVIARCIQKKSDISSGWLSKIIEEFPKYSAEWLLTGKGGMMKAEERLNKAISSKEKASQDKSTEPLYLIESVKELAIENHELKKELEDLKREKKATEPPGYDVAAEPIVKPSGRK